MNFTHPLAALLIAVAGGCFAANAEQIAEMRAQAFDSDLSAAPGSDAVIEAAPVPAPAPAAGGTKSVSNAINKSNWVVLGYIQNSGSSGVGDILHQYPWHAITHVANNFNVFDINGNITNPATWTGRRSELTAGGVADRYGVKVLMCVANGNSFDETILNTVMQDPTRRQTLATAIGTLVNPDTYCAGVNLDFEFNWSSATRDGITDFLSRLRTAIGPNKEISMYLGPQYPLSGTYSGVNKYDFPAWMQYLNWINFSCYSWGGSWSDRTSGISPETSYRVHVDRFIQNGVPADKLILTFPSYGYNYDSSQNAYNALIDPSPRGGDGGSLGFYRAKYDTTIAAPPITRNYATGAEVPWTSVPNASAGYSLSVYDDEFSLERKMRQVRYWHGTQNTGRRLGGVGFWSMMWMVGDAKSGAFNSRDMETGTNVDKNRFYPQIFQAVQELFVPPGVKTYLIEKWEGPTLDARWRNPGTAAEADDNLGVSAATRAFQDLQSGGISTGRPADSDYGLNISYTFTATANNRFFFRHEVLADPLYPSIRDTMAVKSYFDITSKVMLDVYTAAPDTVRTVRFVLMDRLGQLEKSPPMSLNASGWRTLTLDIPNTAFTAYDTAFNQYVDGNGVLDTAGGGAKDLAFIGLQVEGQGQAGSGDFTIDELRYTHSNAGGADFLINELRYNGTQFVEITGPPNVQFPAGTELRGINGTDGSIGVTVNLSGQTMPADGFYVVGDIGVPNVDQVISGGFMYATPLPSAVQLYNTNTATIYDAVTYGSWQTVGQLDGIADPVVTENGPGYLGEIAAGTDTTAQVYTMGRYPDGANTWINGNDFSFMPASPGAANGNSVNYGVPYDYENAGGTPNGYQAFQQFASTAYGAIPAPTGGGASGYRCVDTTGGGNMGMIGDAALGAAGNGYQVEGKLYVQPGTAPVQANGIGICGRQGTRYFTATPASTGGAYESGYWLTFENAAGVGLNDLDPGVNHPGEFRFIWYTNDGQDAVIGEVLGTKTLAQLGLSSTGGWTDFYLSINPNADPGWNLIARINGVDVYSGAIPAGGPTSGAFQVGFRENHAGTPVASEGTWIDNVKFGTEGVPVSVSGWSLE